MHKAKTMKNGYRLRSNWTGLSTSMLHNSATVDFNMSKKFRDRRKLYGAEELWEPYKLSVWHVEVSQHSSLCVLLMSWLAVLWHLLSCSVMCFGYKDVGSLCFNPFKPTKHLRRKKDVSALFANYCAEHLAKDRGVRSTTLAGQSDNIKPWLWVMWKTPAKLKIHNS